MNSNIIKAGANFGRTSDTNLHACTSDRREGNPWAKQFTTVWLALKTICREIKWSYSGIFKTKTNGTHWMSYCMSIICPWNSVWYCRLLLCWRHVPSLCHLKVLFIYSYISLPLLLSRMFNSNIHINSYRSSLIISSDLNFHLPIVLDQYYDIYRTNIPSGTIPPSSLFCVAPGETIQIN